MKHIFGFFGTGMASKGLRYKLLISFSLMSVIPLLVLVYLATSFIFPEMGNLVRISIILLLSIAIAFLGLVLARRLVDPVIDMSIEARMIASGKLGHKIKVDSQDEIGDLGRSINAMTQKIKSSMLELQQYSIKTKDVHLDIQKKVLALSSLMKISDMIATSEKLSPVIDIIIGKLGEMYKDSSAVIFLAPEGNARMAPKASHNIDKKKINKLSFKMGSGYLGVMVAKREVLKIDSSVKPNARMREASDMLGAQNCLVIPVSAHGKAAGFLFIGNDNKNFMFDEDDIEVIKILGKQLGIAIENNILADKAKKLAVKDELTGLYNDKYIRERLNEEISRAILYQRPCSLLLFNIDDFKRFRDQHGEMLTEDVLKRIASILKKSATEVSKAARLGGDEFAIVMPEKNKREATQLAEEVRKKIADANIKGPAKDEKPLTVSGGVSENPIDGITSKDLFDKAASAMKKAKLEGKNRIST